jgi:hypothetical protein
MKYFKEGIVQDIEASLVYHLLEEIRKENEPMLIMKEFDMGSLENGRMKLLSNYMCWNLRLIDTNKFMEKLSEAGRFIV